MWTFLQTPQPRANSSPVGGWTTWSGHSVPSSCLPLGPTVNLRVRGKKKKEKNTLMLADNVNKHLVHFVKKTPPNMLSEGNLVQMLNWSLKKRKSDQTAM